RASARGEARPNAKPAPRRTQEGARGVMGARAGDRKGAKGSRSGGDRRGSASTRGAAPKGKPARNRRDDASLDHRPRLS
ncbi:MAG: hypothetical protein QM519_06400, partial [Bacteroidia bacterium]|nr:hypothetical protein [Bacteroidia bacterium]